MAETGTSAGFNRPSLVAVLYLLTYFVGITALVGVILAYIWRAEPEGEWEASHWRYLITTFWMALGGAVLLALGVAGLVCGLPENAALPGGLALAAAALALAILLLVRCVRSLANAQARKPMPRPGSWLA